MGLRENGMRRQSRRTSGFTLLIMELALCLSALPMLAQNTGAGTSSAPPSSPQAPGAATNSSDDQLRKAAENPLANLVNVPIQNTSSFESGEYGRTQNIAKIEPVVPVRLSSNWNLIVRAIQPLTWQPDDKAPTGMTFGLGDLNPSFFISPEYPGKIIWGAGPVFVFPTGTNAALGSGKFSIGPTAAVLTQPGPWTLGVLMNNYWSVAGFSDRKNVNQMLIQYFLSYNFKRGWYLTSSPISTANWMEPSGKRWVVPLGGGIGRLVLLGPQAAKLSVQVFGNVVNPPNASPWSLRFQFALLYPKKSSSD